MVIDFSTPVFQGTLACQSMKEAGGSLFQVSWRGETGGEGLGFPRHVAELQIARVFIRFVKAREAVVVCYLAMKSSILMI